MRIDHRMHALLAAALTATLALGLAACGGYGSADTNDASPSNANGTASTTTTGSVSRAKLYGSVDALTADSDAVIVGTVASTTVARDLDDATDFTLATVTVLKAVKGAADADGTVTVRQTGSAAQHTPETLLKANDVVLLFLAKSGLPGDQASQYYVTGATAGLYEASGDSATTLRAAAQTDTAQAASAATFSRVNADSGDTLPATLTLGDLS